ncbi:outer membrane beta-barrel protein [Pedobacter ginsenosidimutans]|nr:outer membrane beta-barrel protein [Pedobacter ginsenosidimutans]
MKPKLIIMALLCAVSWHCYAQTEKGSGFIGGSISFGTSKQNSSSVSLNTFTLTPRGGYFLANNFAIGLEIPLNLSKLRGESYTAWNEEYGYYEEQRGVKEFSLGISPFVRKYVDVKNRFKFFMQANLLLQINTFNRIDEEGYLIRTDAKIKGWGASISPGFSYFLSRHATLEFSLPVVSFFHQNYYAEESLYNYDKTNNLKLALQNFTPTFTFNYHF